MIKRSIFTILELKRLFNRIRDMINQSSRLIFTHTVHIWLALLKMAQPRSGTRRKENYNILWNLIRMSLNSVERGITSYQEDLIKLSMFGKQDFMIVWKKTSIKTIRLSVRTGKRLCLSSKVKISTIVRINRERKIMRIIKSNWTTIILKDSLNRFSIIMIKRTFSC